MVEAKKLIPVGVTRRVELFFELRNDRVGEPELGRCGIAGRVEGIDPSDDTAITDIFWECLAEEPIEECAFPGAGWPNDENRFAARIGYGGGDELTEALINIRSRWIDVSEDMGGELL